LGAGTVTVALEFFLGFGGVAREGNSKEAIAGDRFLCDFAHAVAAVFDALDGGIDFAERFLFARDEAESEVTVEGIGASVGHVLSIGREIARVIFGRAFERFFRMQFDAGGEVAAEVEKQLVVTFEFIGHFDFVDSFDRFYLFWIEA